MDLLYIYDERSEYLITSKYNIFFNEENRELSIEYNDNYIEKFWADNVSDVIAIVGDNGAGKTMLLKKIMEVMSFLQREENIFDSRIAVFENKNDLEVYLLNKCDEIKVNAGSLKVKVIEVDEHTLDVFLKIRTAYFNNMFSFKDSQNKVKRYIDDSSLAGLIYNNTQYMGYKKDIFEIDIEYILNYHYQIEQQKIVEYVFKDMKNIEFELPFELPRQVKVELSKGLGAMDRMELMIDDKNYNRYMDNKECFEIKEYFEELNKIYQNSFVFNLLLQLVANLFLEICVTMEKEKSCLQESEEDNVDMYINAMKSTIKKGSNGELKTILDFAESLFQFLKNRVKECETLNDACDDYLMFTYWIKKNISFFKNKDKDETRNFWLNVDKISVNQVNQFLNYYSRTSRVSPYLIFDFGLSAGEYNYLSMFTNLYSIVNNETKEITNVNNNKKIKCNNLILLLDEMDISMHVRWQQKYLEWLIHFVSSVFVNCEVKIIFTTHSPIILSDMPKDNVIYLEKGKKVNYFNCRRCIDTFGNNIHTLFLDSFFLENTGTIGAFAERKINEIAEHLLNYESFTDNKEIKTIIQYIGDEIVRNKLEELYERKTNCGIREDKKIVNEDALDITIELLEKQRIQIEETIQELKVKKYDKNTTE